MSEDLFTLASPAFPRAARQWIESRRRLYDARNQSLIAPHFTLSFAQSETDRDTYVAHVGSVALRHSRFMITCRRAVVGTDFQSPSGFVFLVPDEGNSAIYGLFEKINSGVLAHCRQDDIPYFPHITIGRFPDLGAARAACDEINAEPIEIVGRIDALSVVSFTGDKAQMVARVPLRDPVAVPVPRPAPQG